MKVIERKEILESLRALGVKDGDTLLIRAGLGSVGRINGGASEFVDVLLDAVGENGTVISLAFTSGASFIKKPKPDNAFDVNKKSYAGALPNAMLKNEKAFRSRHPMCSYVAIGKHAEYLTRDHNEFSLAYEPVRKTIELGGKCVLIGCVKDSPGFTTAHLAESDVGLLKVNIFPKLLRVYYKDPEGQLKLFKRVDPGLCSKSFYKFYGHYVREGILRTGFVGNAYSILAEAEKAYEIEKGLLKGDRFFNICGDPDCFVCNARRWDRVQYLPLFFVRKILQKIKAKVSS